MAHILDGALVTLCVHDGAALVPDVSRAGKEYRCPVCGAFTAFFDDHAHGRWGELTDAQRAPYLRETMETDGR